ncbi:MAG: hypothetical protein IKX56_03540 [Muribaculaceae bacterium]|nr:hypothetical protein [Muribaculaceae bacterium]
MYDYLPTSGDFSLVNQCHFGAVGQKRDVSKLECLILTINEKAMSALHAVGVEGTHVS